MSSMQQSQARTPEYLGRSYSRKALTVPLDQCLGEMDSSSNHLSNEYISLGLSTDTEDEVSGTSRL